MLVLASWACLHLVSGLGELVQRPAPPPGQELSSLIRAFMTESDREKRGRLIPAIEDASGRSPQAVAETLQSLAFWDGLDSSDIDIDIGAGEPLRAVLRVPSDYDALRSYAMVFALGADEPICLEKMKTALGEVAEDFVLACAQWPGASEFHGLPQTAEVPRRLHREIRTRVHTSPDRVYLYGEGRGADAAWLLALMQPDLWAGAIIVSGYPPVPYPEQLYPLLLPNIAGLPILSIWEEAEARPAMTRAELVDVHNTAMASMAAQERLPITAVRLPLNTAASIRVGQEAAQSVLGQNRKAQSQVSLWFRYPAQGRAAWLRVEALRGDPWTAEQLAIRPSTEIEWGEFITSVLTAKLAHVRGRVADNTITLTTWRCARVDILLSPVLVDFSKPIRVDCNGLKRMERVVEPSIAVLLQEAYETWDFQRLVWARIGIDIETDAAAP